MKTHVFRSITLAAALLGASAGFATAQGTTSAPDADVANAMINAIQGDNYSAFVGAGTPQFQQMPQGQFEAIASQLGPKLRAGHTLTYVGDLHQHGYDVTLWKITFSDGSDDALAKIAVQNGKVGGFSIE